MELLLRVVAPLCLLLGLEAVAAPAAAQRSPYLNVSQGGALRAGVYGRIEFGNAPPPPLIYPRPVIASQWLVPADVRPVYLYVPPGHARKWKLHCAKYQACAKPVLFVRMDDSPSRLGTWKRLARGDAPAAPADRTAALPVPRGELVSLRQP